MEIAELATLLQPLGVPGAIVVCVLCVLIYIRKNQIIDSRDLIRLQADQTSKLRADRDAAELRADLAFERARHWEQQAHEQRIGRVSDRGVLIDAARPGIDLRDILPPVPEIEEFDDPT